MNTTPPLLTDEQIMDATREISIYAHMARWHLARAIESATRAPLLAEIERLTAERDAARAAIAAQSQAEPVEFSSPYGHCIISGPREDVEFILRHLPDVDDPQPAAQPVAIQGYKCISSAGAAMFTESADAASEMQRQGWTVIELVAAPNGGA